MPWSALDKDTGRNVWSFRFGTKESLLAQHTNLVCHECEEKFCVKTSVKGNVFFSHKGENLCSLNRNKSHDLFVFTFAQRFKQELSIKGLDEKYLIYLEQVYRNEAGESRRADIAIVDAATKKPIQIFEIQLSPISEQELLDRTQFYVEQDVDVVWLWAANSSKTKYHRVYCNRKLRQLYSPVKVSGLNDDDPQVAEVGFKAIWNRFVNLTSKKHFFPATWSGVDFSCLALKHFNLEALQKKYSHSYSPTPRNVAKKDRLPANYQKVKSDRLYRVDSFGEVFEQCKLIGTALVSGQQMWHFESYDVHTKGNKFFSFCESDFELIAQEAAA